MIRKANIKYNKMERKTINVSKGEKELKMKVMKRIWILAHSNHCQKTKSFEK